MANVLVESRTLEDIADAIREKTGGSETYKPGDMGEGIRSIESGGGGGEDEKLYIFTRVSRAGTTATIINDYTYLTARLCFYHDDLISGTLVHVYPASDYIITSITGIKSGNSIPFTSQSGTYTFNMPDESVEINQQYND